jgi:hypothetical protein
LVTLEGRSGLRFPSGNGVTLPCRIVTELIDALQSAIPQQPEHGAGELVEVEAVEAQLRAFRNRVLGIGGKFRHLPPRDEVKVTSELRAALTELAEPPTP